LRNLNSLQTVAYVKLVKKACYRSCENWVNYVSRIQIMLEAVALHNSVKSRCLYAICFQEK
jgi:hypothetical protein